MCGVDTGSLDLQYWTAEHGWDTLWSRDGVQQDSPSSAWLDAQVVVPLQAGALRFVGMTGYGAKSDMAVDNVVAAAVTPLECLVRFGGTLLLAA